MRFASKTMSLVISGLFCIIWMLILAMPVLPFVRIIDVVEVLKLRPAGTIITIGFSFVILPFAYITGGVMNLIASHFFQRENKLYQTEYFPGRDYNLMRFSLYGLSEEVYDHLNYHRDIIRVFRSSCINFFLIFTSFLFVAYADTFKPHLWLRFVPVIFVLLYTVKYVGQRIAENVAYDRGLKVLFFGLPVILLVYFNLKGDLPYGHAVFSYFLFVLVGLSYVCAWGWHQQTRNFYKAILKSHSALV